ncbi:MAG: hydantoinase B/oxoprolinase family protein [Gammaproteobacteria bacterium]
MNIIDSTMVSICREMGITLMKTSYSTIFNEALDFTCALADANGDMIAVAEFCPAQIGGMPLCIKTCAQEIPFDTLEEGDVIVHNDPYRGGLHTPEHTFFKPVFFHGELVGFSVAIGHIAEIGGMVPGAFAGEATEIFHEGIRVPPVKIKKAGVDVDEVWKLLLANVRTPRYNYGDLRALISSVDRGEQRLMSLIEKYGKEVFVRNTRDLMDYSERRMRAEIEAIADGTYSFEDVVENDGIEDREYLIHVDVNVQGDEIVVDYTGTSEQARGPINATLGVTWSATYNGLLHLTDPSIPKNSGCFRPIKVVAPPGTVVNVDYPAPEVGGNTETHPRIAGAVIGAMSPAVPHRSMAAEGSTHINFVFGGHDPVMDEYFACYDIELVGWGGRADADGNDAQDSINGNCRVMPVEVFETRYPWLIEEYTLVQDSGGPGRHRGGLGTTKCILCRTTDITVSQMTDRHRIKPWGLTGGLEGGNGATLLNSKGTSDWLTVVQAHNKSSSSKFSNVVFRPGDRVRLVTPGGGGYGDPRERDPATVQEDLAEGYISAQQAEDAYGFTQSGAD